MTDIAEPLRRVAFGAAYRMLGSVDDADDVASSAIERLLALRPDDRPANPEAWLMTVATRIAIDELRSARVRREEYVGAWLPEPLVGRLDRKEPDPPGHAERAAFLLHDVFDYSYGEVASVLERPSQASVRQLVSRAGARLSDRVPRYPASAAQQQELVTRFIAAVESGAVEQFTSLLTTDVVATTDGGGNVPPGFAIARSVHGIAAVSKLLASYHRRAVFPVRMEPWAVNGGPGLVLVATPPAGGGVIGVMSLDVREARIAAIHGVVNPEKLQHLDPDLGPLADLDALRDAELAAHRRRS